MSTPPLAPPSPPHPPAAAPLAAASLPHPPAAAPLAAASLPHETLAGIAAAVPAGIAVFTGEHRCTFINEAGTRLIGAATPGQGARAMGAAGCSPAALRRCWPDLEFTTAGTQIITFTRAPTCPGGAAAQLAGLSGAVAAVAESGSLVSALEAIAGAVKDELDLAAANIVLHGDAGTGYVQLLGGAGFAGTSPERLASMRSCEALGAELKHREALRSGRVVVVPHRYQSVMTDPRWGPSHELLETADWDGFAAAPLRARGRVVGTLSVFYPPGATSAAGEVERLTAVAGQAAAAVDSASLLAATRRRAVAQERNRLGRELHDAIVQDVFSLAVHARTIQVAAEAGGPLGAARIRAGTAELIGLSRSALTALRALIFELRPPALQDHSLTEAVRAYAASMTGRCGVPIAVVDERARTAMPEAASEHIYRVVQEALHNVVRHARATRVSVSFREQAGGGTLVEIADDGVGFDPAAVSGGHLGLITMRERAEELGGTLDVRTGLAAGTSVLLRVPPATRTARTPS